jgi:5-methylcytosine-specific restriction endonuclease McrA
MSSKICTVCKEEVELEMFSKKTRAKDGLRSECKSCQKQAYLNSRKKTLGELKIKYERNKEFFYNKNKAYYALNRDSILAQKKEYHKLNIEKLNNKNRKYYSDNRDSLLAQKSIYCRTDRFRLKNIIRSGARRSKVKCGDVTLVQLVNLKENSTNCHWCEIEINNTIKIHIDHVIPLSRGGLHTISNLVVSCAKCNIQKGCKMPDVFREELNNGK